MPKKLRIIVLGMMGRCPFGGQTWLYLHWLYGIAALGHEVWYVEDDSVWPYDPGKYAVTDDSSYAVKHIDQCLKRIGLENRWAYRLRGTENEAGLTGRQLDRLYGECDVLLNVVGATELDEEHMKVPLRVYVETDPVIAELQLANGDPQILKVLSAHNAFVTYGENYGAPDCGVPLDGLKFVKTRQPIALELWPAVFTPEAERFTTIGNYRQEGNDLEYRGQTYRWSKHHEWEKILQLPSLTDQRFELALQMSEADRTRLESFGWETASPYEMSLDVFGAYPAYIRASRGEFTVAKDQNVRLRSGWFSERDAVYLASGKPVITHDTGFGNILPTGEGLFAFSDMDDVLRALDEINSDYTRHCQAARRIANDHFEAQKVIRTLLNNLGLA